jgi:hypothetical protein
MLESPFQDLLSSSSSSSTVTVYAVNILTIMYNVLFYKEYVPLIRRNMSIQKIGSLFVSDAKKRQFQNNGDI